MINTQDIAWKLPIGEIAPIRFDPAAQCLVSSSRSAYYKPEGILSQITVEKAGMSPQQGREREATRLSWRCIGSNIPDMEGLEARVPLNHHQQGFDLLYFAVHNHLRGFVKDEIVKERELLQRSCFYSAPNLPSALPKGFSLEQPVFITRTSEEDLIDLTELYSETLPNHNPSLRGKVFLQLASKNLLYTIRNLEDSKIVAAGIGNISVMPTVAGNLHQGEISRLATLGEYRSKGLAKYLVSRLISAMQYESDVIIANVPAGLALANRVFYDNLFTYCGTLQKHSIRQGNKEIYDVKEISAHENLNVWSFTPRTNPSSLFEKKKF